MGFFNRNNKNGKIFVIFSCLIKFYTKAVFKNYECMNF